MTSSTIAVDGLKQNDTATNLLNVTRVGVVALGGLGIILARPAYIVASLAADVALESLELGKALYNCDSKAAIHLVSLTVTSLVLGAIVLGSWKLMTGAAGVNALYVIIMSVYSQVASEDSSDKDAKLIDMFCYWVLFSVSLTAALHEIPRYTDKNYSTGRKIPPMDPKYFQAVPLGRTQVVDRLQT